MTARATRFYTTHQVAALMGVSLASVVNWVKGGRLDAHRTPGGHRRIRPDALVAFADAHGYPLPDEVRADARTRRTVLVVDAERDFADMVREYLEIKGGFEVLVAESGFFAGLLIGARQPDVVLLDLGLGDLDGPRALEHIRASLPNTVVFATTAFRTPALERQIDEAGFDGSLEKPVQLDQLLALLLR
jgi:excisionase family DNA binding protein